MAKKQKLMTIAEIDVFKEKLELLLAQPTWNKFKYRLQDDLDAYLSGFRHFEILRIKDFPKFSDGKPFLKWDYEIVTIPEKKTGFFMQFRDKKVLIFCRNRETYGRRQLIVIPLKG